MAIFDTQNSIFVNLDSKPIFLLVLLDCGTKQDNKRKIHGDRGCIHVSELQLVLIEIGGGG